MKKTFSGIIILTIAVFALANASLAQNRGYFGGPPPAQSPTVVAAPSPTPTPTLTPPPAPQKVYPIPRLRVKSVPAPKPTDVVKPAPQPKPVPKESVAPVLKKKVSVEFVTEKKSTAPNAGNFAQKPDTAAAPRALEEKRTLKAAPHTELVEKSLAEYESAVKTSGTKASGTKPAAAIAALPPCRDVAGADEGEYAVGVDDILEISVLKPEQLSSIVTVTPDGSVTFPYVGNIPVKGRSVSQVQEEIQTRLAEGYMRYPIVAVSLRESRSRKFFVYGEVLKPGSYPMEDNMTVLRAISMAGGFSRFGSSSRVKILRPKSTGPGYDMVKVNIKSVMAGNAGDDVTLKQGDIVVVSEGVF